MALQGKCDRSAHHDFPDPEVPKAVPCGVYDIGQNAGWVNVGMGSDTAEFAVESIRQLVLAVRVQEAVVDNEPQGTNRGAVLLNRRG